MTYSGHKYQDMSIDADGTVHDETEASSIKHSSYMADYFSNLDLVATPVEGEEDTFIMEYQF